MPNSFKDPLEIIWEEGQLRSFLNQSGLEARGFENAHFLNVGDSLTIGGQKYLVSHVYLKMFDYRLLVELDGSEIHIMEEVEKATSE